MHQDWNYSDLRLIIPLVVEEDQASATTFECCDGAGEMLRLSTACGTMMIAASPAVLNVGSPLRHCFGGTGLQFSIVVNLARIAGYVSQLQPVLLGHAPTLPTGWTNKLGPGFVLDSLHDHDEAGRIGGA